MKRAVFVVGLAASIAPALAAFDRDAQSVLGGGRWGLVEGSGTASDIAEARKCDKATMSFAFSESEVQRIVAAHGAPPAGPPDSFAEIRSDKGVTGTMFSFYTAAGDALPAAIYAYDDIGRTLAHSDAIPGELYALCDN